MGIGTGNVEYHGDVVIHGGIKPGAKVSTSGSLTVDGICENCVIEAGKDIVLRSGVLGGNKTSIRAGGNIHAKFFEYCKVKADGFIEVTYALDSHMISFDHILCNRKKGKYHWRICLRNQWNGCECNRKFHGSKDTGACRSQCADAAGTVGSARNPLKKMGK